MYSLRFFLICSCVLSFVLFVVSGTSSQLSSTTYGGETILASSTGDNGVELIGPGTRLSSDFVKRLDSYTVYFSHIPGDNYVEFTAYDTPLKLKPSNLNGKNFMTPSFNPYLLDSDIIEYRNIYGDIDMYYQMDDTQLKELIVINEDSGSSIGLSSSTVTIDFILLPSEKTVPSIDGITRWDEKTQTTGDDIVFIRKKEPHKLYVVNKFYIIKAPYLNDSNGNKIDLTYTLKKQNDELLLQLNIPPLKERLTYPITIDPTIEWNDNDGVDLEWENWDDCSSSSSDCTYIDSTPEGVKFSVDWNCNDSDPYSHPVQKGLFEFDITDLYDYGGSLDEARLWTEGSCNLNSLMPDGSTIYV